MIKAGLITKPLIIALLLLATSTPIFASPPSDKSSKNEARSANASNSSCLAKEKSLSIRMAQLSQLVATQESTFDKISTRVQNYYMNTLVPSNRTISNYSDLVNDIAAKKSIVDQELATAKSSISSFSCATDNPRTTLNNFRMSMQKVKTALKNYRTSVKNLIVTVSQTAEK